MIKMRKPCSDCGDIDGNVEDVNGQRIVRCAWCHRYCYTQPRSEAGLAPRKVAKREPFSPAQRQRVLERDGHACISCHTTDAVLHVGHLVSVADGRNLGMSDDDINDDLNLAAMCETCNLGLGPRSLQPRLVWAAIVAAQLRKGGGNVSAA